MLNGIERLVHRLQMGSDHKVAKKEEVKKAEAKAKPEAHSVNCAPARHEGASALDSKIHPGQEDKKRKAEEAPAEEPPKKEAKAGRSSCVRL